jgi:hypothetical protein
LFNEAIRLSSVGAASTEDLRASARRLVLGVFEALREERVLPTSRYNPFIKVGQDYFGDTVRGVGEYVRFEQILAELCPARFAKIPATNVHRECPSQYAFAIIEVVAARCGVADTFDAPDDVIERSIDDLISTPASETYELVCCRVVSHLTTVTGGRFQLAGST